MKTRTRLLLFVVLVVALAWLGIKLAQEERRKADTSLRRPQEKAPPGGHAPQPPASADLASRPIQGDTAGSGPRRARREVGNDEPAPARARLLAGHQEDA
jgi:hypothetical protein